MGSKTRRKVKRKSRSKYPGRQTGGNISYGVIPNVIIQTSKDPIPEYVLEQLQLCFDGWEYKYFSDTDILQFFTDNPLEEFPDITAKFHSISDGPHKADLFRYYYLYMNGGVYIDKDLMVYDDLSNIIGESSFVTVKALSPPGSIFNGFLAAAPKHLILYAALKDMYSMNTEILQKNYDMVVTHLGGIVDANPNTNMKILNEIYNSDLSYIQDPVSKKVVLIHYKNGGIPDIPIRT